MFLRPLLYLILLAAALHSSVWMGGRLILAAQDGTPLVYRLSPAATLALLGVAVTAGLGTYLWCREGRRFVRTSLLGLALVLATVYGTELLASFLTPPWPALGLHGADPDVGAQNWGRVVSVNGGTGFNSWGQRDHERRRKPAPETYRTVFVGDSILEESMKTPLSILVEERLRMSRVEVINLGVSGTEPDDYYYRTKNIALPLAPNHCVLFFYMGNDFAAERTLRSFGGVAATYPRDSVLSKAHLLSINHLLTNHHRQTLREWGFGAVHERAESVRQQLALMSDTEIESFLLGFVSKGNKPRLRAKLAKADMSSFYDMLRHPDENLFRMFLVEAGAQLAAGEYRAARITFRRVAFRWIRRIHQLCEDRGISFTLIVVPISFEVDQRMRTMWAPLADMRWVNRSAAQAARRLTELARAEGLDTLDLHDFLQDYPGSYLNLDGHFSSYGAEVVAGILAEHLAPRVRATRGAPS